jgi:hypothetical protein
MRKHPLPDEDDKSSPGLTPEAPERIKNALNQQESEINTKDQNSNDQKTFGIGKRIGNNNLERR